jgi:putative cardiolipin synthase
VRAPSCPPSQAYTDTVDTRLGRALAPGIAAHPGRSGVFGLPDPRDAFAARVLLARTAERSLDVQYYIWHGDRSGTLLFSALHDAAERGVRVRLLLDDNNTGGLDPVLGTLDAHPNIEVRLFNPFPMRNARMLGFLTDFSRLNRRMHNKSFTADNQLTVVGGRNVGDEYFGAGDGVLFTDLDVVTCGPVVGAVSGEFDRYWDSGSAYPASRIVPAVDDAAVAEVRARFAAVAAEPGTATYIEAVRNSGLVESLLDGRLAWEWAPTRLISDDPAKGLDKAEARAQMLYQMGQVIGAPAERVDLVSPYFVPEEAGTETFAALARRGVAVRILTNALEANDVAAVHAGYAKWRKPLLEAGVRLYELKRTAAMTPPSGKSHDKAKGLGGSSAASLHAKTFSVDARRAFVGSFNFDPRSARLNTELGLVIDSPRLAQAVVDALDRELPLNAYEVQLDGEGGLVWLDRSGDTVVRHTHDPGVSAFKRGLVKVMSWLPIDGLL